MNYLLDTNACIALIRNDPSPVRTRLEQTIDHGRKAFVSPVVIFELWYGVSKSSRPEANARALQTFLAGPIERLPFDDEDAQFAGAVRAELERIGKPIGAYDLLIAGQALRHKMTLITTNVAEFKRVNGLVWEDWGKRSPRKGI